MFGYAIVAVPLWLIFVRWLTGRAYVASPKQVRHRLPLSTPFRYLLLFAAFASVALGVFCLGAAVVGFGGPDFTRSDMLGMAMMSIALTSYPWLILRYMPVVATQDHLILLGGRIAWSELRSIGWNAFGIKLIFPPSFRLSLTGEFTLNWFVWAVSRGDVAVLERLWHDSRPSDGVAAS